MTMRSLERDRCSQLEMNERPRELQHDHRADQHRRKDGKEDRPADQPHSAVDHPDFLKIAVVLGSAAIEDQRFELSGSVDDAREAAGARIEEGADAGEQEHGRQRELDDVRDFGRRAWERLWHIAAYCPFMIIFFTPRAAWRSRCSFSTSAIRT